MKGKRLLGTPWVALNSERCPVDGPCETYEMHGGYRTTTNGKGKHFLRIDSRLSWEKGKRLRNTELTVFSAFTQRDGKTEWAVNFWKPLTKKRKSAWGWQFASLESSCWLKDALMCIKNPKQNSCRLDPAAPWSETYFQEENQSLNFSIIRPYQHKQNDFRTWKIGEQVEWKAGFINGESSWGISKKMEIQLNKNLYNKQYFETSDGDVMTILRTILPKNKQPLTTSEIKEYLEDHQQLLSTQKESYQAQNTSPFLLVIVFILLGALIVVTVCFFRTRRQDSRRERLGLQIVVPALQLQKLPLTDRGSSNIQSDRLESPIIEKKEEKEEALDLPEFIDMSQSHSEDLQLASLSQIQESLEFSPRPLGRLQILEEDSEENFKKAIRMTLNSPDRVVISNEILNTANPSGDHSDQVYGQIYND